MPVYSECSWDFVDGTGSEMASLSRGKSDWVIQGQIARTIAQAQIEVEYVILCDSSWRTKTAKVVVSNGKENRKLDLCNNNGFWFQDGERCPALDGCVDVDLEWSPSTNTLPLRRLNIPVGGESGFVTAAWIRFPELRTQPLLQNYRRMAEDTYLYRSHGGTFEAEISVDRHLLVVSYEGLWERVTSRPAHV